MSNKFYLVWIVIVIAASLVYLLTEKISLKVFKIKADKVAFESAKTALERLSGWVTWLTGLQTAAMAAMALLIKDKEKPLTDHQTEYGFFVLLFFGASIVLSTWLLSSIPSAQLRLNESTTPDEKNDIYRMKIFGFVPFTIGRFSGIIHTYFLIGVIFFALFIFSLF
jgi:hypothetical protein